jgi:hypothetical protein
MDNSIKFEKKIMEIGDIRKLYYIIFFYLIVDFKFLYYIVLYYFFT